MDNSKSPAFPYPTIYNADGSIMEIGETGLTKLEHATLVLAAAKIQAGQHLSQGHINDCVDYATQILERANR